MRQLKLWTLSRIDKISFWQDFLQLTKPHLDVKYFTSPKSPEMKLDCDIILSLWLQGVLQPPRSLCDVHWPKKLLLSFLGAKQPYSVFIY